MQETLVEVPGGQIAVQSYGGAGRPVVFVHGVGLCGPHWRHFAETVNDRCRPYSLDLPGHAHSTVPMRTADDQWRHLAGVVRSLGLEGAVLVGHDTGAWAAVAAATAEPQLYSALVLVGGTMTRILDATSLVDDLSFQTMLVERFGFGRTGVGEQEARALQTQLAQRAAQDWMLADLEPGLFEEVGHSIVPLGDDVWRHTPTVATMGAAYSFDASSPSYPSPDLLARLTVPTWVVRLTEGYDANVREALPEGATSVREVTFDAGQWPQYSAVGPLAEVLTDALGALD